jgi:hypothetical protein
VIALVIGLVDTVDQARAAHAAATGVVTTVECIERGPIDLVGQASLIAVLAGLLPKTSEGRRSVVILLLFSAACLGAALWMHQRASDPLHAADMAAPVRK